MVGLKVRAHCAVCAVGGLETEAAPVARVWVCFAQGAEVSRVFGLEETQVQIRVLFQPLTLVYYAQWRKLGLVPWRYVPMSLVQGRGWGQAGERSPADLGLEVYQE
jgi:hypothetical protein